VWSKKRHKVYGAIILQPYITESWGFSKMQQGSAAKAISVTHKNIAKHF